ncbi:MAG: YcgL domain-containing protein [Gammaproteobacteria bacterium]|nr:YcgL domain-containing protein [Gammaproteobacteria bacterium]
MTDAPFECDVYKSLRHEYMYVYVKREEGLEHVPEALLEHFRTRLSLAVAAAWRRYPRLTR